MARPESTKIIGRPRVKDTELHTDYGKRLRKWRKNKGMTMDDMADAITDRGYHIESPSYRNFERGSLPPMRVMVILHRMGIDLNWLITGTE